MEASPHHPPAGVVAVAASAGGVEALVKLVETLPADFPGAVLVVLHVSAAGPSVLPAILARAGRLPAAHAQDGAPLRAGTVVIAPPGHHLRLRDGHVALDRGPRVNGHRPSADALFRSVAGAFRNRAAGVVLSGTMDDGAAGLRAIRAAGGFTVVQDPEDAAFPGMPAAAIAEADPNLVCPVDEMAGPLVQWMAKLPDLLDAPDPYPPANEAPRAAARPSPFTCPECGGTLWLEPGEHSERFVCRVGHTFSPRGLLAGKQDALEAALWAAIVALEERADLDRHLLERLEGRGRPDRLSRYEENLAYMEGCTDVLRRLVDDVVHHGLLISDDRTDDADTAP